MKKKEINKLTKEQSIKEYEKMKKELFNIRFQKINGQVKNPSKINETKRNIAIHAAWPTPYIATRNAYPATACAHSSAVNSRSPNKAVVESYCFFEKWFDKRTLHQSHNKGGWPTRTCGLTVRQV